MNHRLRLWFCSLSCVLGLSLHAERPCGEAKILSGSTCESLRVVFRLKSCGLDRDEMAQVICKESFPAAVFYGEKQTYFAPLRELSPGVWSVVGTVREYSKNWSPTPSEVRKQRIIIKSNASPINPDETINSLLEIGGQFRFRSEQNRKNDFATNRAFSSVRLRSDFWFRPTEGISFLLEPQANSILGEPSLVGATSSLNIPAATSGANRDPLLTFHQALAELKLTPTWRFILGRQTLIYDDEVLVGASDWENPGTSFDGVRSRLEGKQFAWEVFTVKLWDSNTKTNGQGDRDFHGTHLSWSDFNRSLEVNPYLFWLRDQRATLKNFHLVGIHSRYTRAQVDVRGELTQQWGERSGQQAWAQLEIEPSSHSTFRFSVDGLWASSGFNPLFPSTHKWLGWADVVGRRNLLGVGARGKFELFRELGVEIRGLHLLRADKSHAVFQADSETPIPNLSGSQQTIGTEADLILSSRILPNVDLTAASSIFLPGELVKSGNLDTWLGRFELSLSAFF